MIALALLARATLGVYDDWAAFRDDAPRRCYAITAPGGPVTTPRRPYVAIARWPGAGVRAQFHARLSRDVPPGTLATLRIGSTRIALTASGGDAWAADPRSDAAIIAALRSASGFAIETPRFSDRFGGRGAASAIDAAMLGCARG